MKFYHTLRPIRWSKVVTSPVVFPSGGFSTLNWAALLILFFIQHGIRDLIVALLEIFFPCIIVVFCCPVAENLLEFTFWACKPFTGGRRWWSWLAEISLIGSVRWHWMVSLQKALCRAMLKCTGCPQRQSWVALFCVCLHRQSGTEQLCVLSSGGSW